jgi:hypothetical protein
MNLSTFFQHYQIQDNPFASEEARHDSVFSRIESACRHPDYEKIRGDLMHPSSAIVFGERGSGKTALRLQIEDEITSHNRQHPDERCLVIAYDELNPVLDRYARHSGKTPADKAIETFRLVDHIDAMMSAIVPRIVDQVIGDTARDGWIDGLDASAARKLRQSDPSVRRDLLLLQLCYDRPSGAGERTRRLKRAIRVRGTSGIAGARNLAVLSLALTLAAAGYFLIFSPQQHAWLWYLTIALLLLLAIAAGSRALWLWGRSRRLAATLAKQVRTLDRSAPSFSASLQHVDAQALAASGLPLTSDDDARYAMFARLLRVLRPLGYRSIIVLVDRVDEPTLVNGEPQRMKALIWPMLNNKFLQQDGVGIKLLLPLDLRYLLERENAEFYRSARLDKQNLIENLSWSGAMLYDVCSARVRACRPGDAPPMSIRDFFDDAVTEQELVDALDQLRQPRDAFKFLYRLIQEHCANVPEERQDFKIPRPLLDSVRKQQVERLSGMLRGVRAG